MFIEIQMKDIVHYDAEKIVVANDKSCTWLRLIDLLGGENVHIMVDATPGQLMYETPNGYGLAEDGKMRERGENPYSINENPYSIKLTNESIQL